MGLGMAAAVAMSPMVVGASVTIATGVAVGTLTEGALAASVATRFVIPILTGAVAMSVTTQAIEMSKAEKYQQIYEEQKAIESLRRDTDR